MRKILYTTDGTLFAVAESGRAVCLDVRTGDILWQRRLRGRYYYANKTTASGRVEIFSNVVDEKSSASA